MEQEKKSVCGGGGGGERGGKNTSKYILGLSVYVWQGGGLGWGGTND